MNGKTKVKFKKVAKHAGITLTLGGTFGLGLLAHWIWLAVAMVTQVEANTETIRDDIKPEVAILHDAMIGQRVHNKQVQDDLKWMKDHWPKQ